MLASLWPSLRLAMLKSTSSFTAGTDICWDVSFKAPALQGPQRALRAPGRAPRTAQETPNAPKEGYKSIPKLDLFNILKNVHY